MRRSALLGRGPHRADLSRSHHTLCAGNRRAAHQGQDGLRHGVGSARPKRKRDQRRRAAAGKATLARKRQLHRCLVRCRGTGLIRLASAGLDDHLGDLGIATRQGHGIAVSAGGWHGLGNGLRLGSRLRSRSRANQVRLCCTCTTESRQQRRKQELLCHVFENHRFGGNGQRLPQGFGRRSRQRGGGEPQAPAS